MTLTPATLDRRLARANGPRCQLRVPLRQSQDVMAVWPRSGDLPPTVLQSTRFHHAREEPLRRRSRTQASRVARPPLCEQRARARLFSFSPSRFWQLRAGRRRRLVISVTRELLSLPQRPLSQHAQSGGWLRADGGAHRLRVDGGRSRRSTLTVYSPRSQRRGGSLALIAEKSALAG
jgi:hypothetical protein